MIAQHGAVSAEVAKALANGIRIRTGATLGLGVTGIAGPSGATEGKPVGLVHIALSSAEKVEAIEKTFRGDRQRVREWTTQQALDLLRRRLRYKPLRPRTSKTPHNPEPPRHQTRLAAEFCNRAWLQPCRKASQKHDGL
jgi:hypothetical protein